MPAAEGEEEFGAGVAEFLLEEGVELRFIRVKALAYGGEIQGVEMDLLFVDEIPEGLVRFFYGFHNSIIFGKAIHGPPECQDLFYIQVQKFMFFMSFRLLFLIM